MNFRRFFAAFGLFSSLLITLPTQAAQQRAATAVTSAATDTAFPPFRIAGNLYYVGTIHGVYMFSTPKGLILINSNYSDSVPVIRKSVEEMGFHMSDIKILLISHAHQDHAGGSAELIKETGAKYEVMDGDADVVESGGATDYIYGDKPANHFPPAHIDRVLHDGDTVELGGTVLTAHLTPGHTKGCTTWTVDETEDGRVLHVVIMGGPTGNAGMKLINNPKYPNIVADYEKGFAVLRKLPCDIPLGAHDWYFDLEKKHERWLAGDKNAFIDPTGYMAFVDKSQSGFEANLQKQKAASEK